MHVVPALENLNRLNAVLQNEIDNSLKLGKIPVPPSRLFLQIPAECRREFSCKPPAHAKAA